MNAEAETISQSVSAPLTLLTDTRATVDTATAAQYLNRQTRTLHQWHCYGRGPISPVAVGGRLAWPLADIRRLMLGEAKP